MLILPFFLLDERFSNDHKITLIFINAATTPNNDLNRQLVFQNPLVRVEPLSNCSSLDNISEGKSFILYQKFNFLLHYNKNHLIDQHNSA